MKDKRDKSPERPLNLNWNPKLIAHWRALPEAIKAGDLEEVKRLMSKSYIDRIFRMDIGNPLDDNMPLYYALGYGGVERNMDIVRLLMEIPVKKDVPFWLKKQTGEKRSSSNLSFAIYSSLSECIIVCEERGDGQNLSDPISIQYSIDQSAKNTNSYNVSRSWIWETACKISNNRRNTYSNTPSIYQ